jgi:hypothetical protein
MTPEQIELMRAHAQRLLAFHKGGGKCDPVGIRWAHNVLRGKK